jgi:hypothetical protein
MICLPLLEVVTAGAETEVVGSCPFVELGRPADPDPEDGPAAPEELVVVVVVAVELVGV